MLKEIKPHQIFIIDAYNESPKEALLDHFGNEAIIDDNVLTYGNRKYEIMPCEVIGYLPDQASPYMLIEFEEESHM